MPELLTAVLAGVPALAVALVGWVLHVQECRGHVAALRAENARLLDALERALERRG